MNKSEIERANVRRIIDDMPPKERDLCNQMILSLLASVGHPISGRTFMMAIAYVNTEIACNTIRLGIVGPEGEDVPGAPATKEAEGIALDAVGKMTGGRVEIGLLSDDGEVVGKTIYPQIFERGTRMSPNGNCDYCGSPDHHTFQHDDPDGHS